MTVPGDPELRADVVDLVFGLRGSGLLGEHAVCLRDELRRRLPWLAAEMRAGVLGLAGLSAGDGGHYLTARTRLALRLPRDRVAEARMLVGQQLDLAGCIVGIERVGERELWPARVLYSALVCHDMADETGFLAESRRQIESKGFRHAALICGKARHMDGGDGEIIGFSLMVHGLAPDESLRLQTEGLGRGQQCGCGIFVPHKSIAAVGGEN